MIKTAIIDDEPHGIKTLKHYLSKTGLAEIIFTSDSGEDGLEMLLSHKIDLLFLDIEMPGLGGIELINRLPTINFQIVFVTAYNQYAIQAIKLNALDYILKPVSQKDLNDAIKRYTEHNVPTQKEQVQKIENIQSGILPNTLALPTLEGIHFVKMEEVILLEANDCYTNVYLRNGKKFVISKTLAHFEELLEGYEIFFRVHKSSIINLSCVIQYIRGEGGEIILNNGRQIALSRTRKKDFLNLFKRI